MTRPARKMKPSGIPWIGDVPADWEVMRLKDVATLNPQTHILLNENDRVSFVPMECLRTGNIEKRERLYSEVAAYTPFLENDILVAKVTPCFENKNIAIAQNLTNKIGLASSEIFIFRQKSINSKFLFYLLLSEYIAAIGVSSMTGTGGLKRVNTNIATCKVPVPPVETQKKIAESLDEKCAEIDALIAVEEKMIAELKSYKQSVITEAVTRGVPAAANAARPLKDSGIPWLGSVPAHWEIRMIKRIFHVFSGTTPKSENPNYWDGSFSWITPADYKTPDKYVSSGRKNLTREGLLSCGLTLLPAGSIIFSKRAPIGAVAIARSELCTNQGCLSCVPRVDLNEEYFYFLMSVFTEQFELLGSGTTFKEISLSDFSKFLLPFPPKSEQCEIVKYLNEESNRINSVISVKQEKITALQNYKKSIIFEYTTGKRES